MNKYTAHDMSQELVANAARWANNILVEVLHNHGSSLSDEQRECLLRVTKAISEFTLIARPGKKASNGYD